MVDIPDPVSGRVGDVAWVVRPEWLAGRHWWRVSVGGHPKVLLRHLQHATQVAEVLAADEELFRRESEAGAWPGDRAGN